MKMVIHTLNLTKTYFKGSANEVVAVKDASVTIEDRVFYIVTGPSGSGKTTLLSLLGLLTRPTRGKIFYQDEEVSSYSDAWQTKIRKQQVGFIFQQYNLLTRFSSWENVSLPLMCHSFSKSERKKQAIEIMERLGLEKKIDFKVSLLSGGEQQRVAIARALVTDPKIIIADEPTASVDDETAASITEIFKTLKKEGKTVIISTHDHTLMKEGTAFATLKNGMVTNT